MENQGYEEESVAQPFGRQYTTQSSSTPIEGPRSSSTAQRIRGIATRHFRSEPEAHVYEDIAVSNLEDVNPASGRPFALPANSINNNNINNINNNKNNNFSNELTSLDSSHWSKIARTTIDDVNDADHFHISNEPTSLTSNEEPEVTGNFHRNRTLPLSSGARVFGEAAKSSSRFSVRVTSRERNGCPTTIEGLRSLREMPIGSSRVAVIDETSGATSGGAESRSRRRRKKDCKHCKSKTNSAGANRELLTTTTAADSNGESATTRSNEDDDNDDSASTFPVDVGRVASVENGEFIGRDEKPSSRLGLEPIFALPDGKLPSFNSARVVGQQQQQQLQQLPNAGLVDKRGNSIFAITNNIGNACNAKHEYEKNEADLLRLGPVELLSDDRALITPQKNRVNGMKVNSIYSHDHWHQWSDHKDGPIFVTDVKEQSPFQRAYSLPTRTQTPSSQNRANLRRSVRGEPPPHPAQLRKNRHGWTLHFARPLDGTGCTRSIVLLLIAILALLGIGGIALYIVFEPEKLQIIQQYLRSSSTPNVSTVSNDTFDDVPMGLEVGATETTTLHAAGGVLFTESLSAFAEDTTVYPKTETEVVPTTSPGPESDVNATRHCDDCYDAEVCVALVDEEVPFCRTGPDPLDPTGCAGLCLINKQKCHRLDVDAFRCVEVEHYCLDDEWTCSNTLCIPLVKHCDGHMNCYDHSDEYDCACDLQTHFQCGNETSCLPLERRCDGKIDCWDATDEINCTLGQDLGWSCPSSGDFTCSNGECILKARFCDGLQDCKDGSDEPHGCQGRCNKHEFSCHNGRCITKAMKCNGIDDCDDGSDEQHCRDRI